MNFTTSILTAGMLGLQAYAARDAFAAHRQALETILDQEHDYYGEHPVRHYDVVDAPHHESRHYDHEYA